MISGPDLPNSLFAHSMVPLGQGQAIIGGEDGNHFPQTKIYHVTCSHQSCMISLLRRELSVPRGSFVAIPIPDNMVPDSGCISESKNLGDNFVLSLS